MSDFQFSPEAACRYGVDEAIFLHSMAFWIRKNEANGKNFHKGRYWTYNKQAALAEIFPFWTPRQIARITASCEEQGAILTDTLAADKSDRTKWYALTDEAAAFHFGTKTVTCNSPNGEMDGPQGVDDCGESDATNSPNGVTEREHPSHQTGDCIKGNSYLPDSKPPISPKGDGGRKKKELPQEVKELLSSYVADDAALKDAMREFMALRLESKKARNTLRAIEMLLKELDELSGGDRAARLRIVRNSVLNGWIGVFPLKGGFAMPKQSGGDLIVV